MKEYGAEPIKTAFALVCVFLFFSLIYLLAGAIISIPYHILAGGLNGNIIPFMLLGPIAVTALLLYGVTEYLTTPKFKVIKSVTFWTVATWAMLPIWMNLSSQILRKVGATNAANLFFKYRYMAMLLPFLIILVLFILELSLAFIFLKSHK